MQPMKPIFTTNYRKYSTIKHCGSTVQKKPQQREHLMVSKVNCSILTICIAILAAIFVSVHLHPWNYVARAANSPTLYTVQSGDSIWSIAERIGGLDDIYQITNEIMIMNRLNGDATIQPGEVLKLPTNG